MTDDVHTVDQAQPWDFWKSDSIQLAIDPDNDSTNAFDDDDREIGLVLTPKGPKVFLDLPKPAKSLNAPVAIRRVDTKTLYEAFIPWTALNLPPPRPSRVLAINFIANDNDGHGRAYWMGLTPGIGEAKNPQAYREFVIGQ